MRQLILVRHAKSDWSDAGLADHDRPLNPRGRRDAPVMARRLAARCGQVDALITSTARRAQDTAAVLAEALELPDQAWHEDPACYHAAPEELLETIRRWPAAWSTAILVGHNPGLSELVDLLSGSTGTDLPTAAVVHLRVPAGTWAKLSPGACQLLGIDTPKRPLDRWLD